MIVHFTVPGEPQGKGRPRFSKTANYVRTYTPANTASYENLVKVEYQRLYGTARFADEELLDMRIFAFFAIPKSASKKRKAQMQKNILRPVKKPDFDNIEKIIADSLNGVAYRDDTQIVDAIVRKFYSEIPRVEVFIRTAKEVSFREKY